MVRKRLLGTSALSIMLCGSWVIMGSQAYAQDAAPAPSTQKAISAPAAKAHNAHPVQAKKDCGSERQRAKKQGLLVSACKPQASTRNKPKLNPVAQADPQTNTNAPPGKPLRTETAESDKPKVVDTKTSIVQRTSITADALRSSGAQNTYEAIQNVPGVTQSDAKGGSIADNVQIRGIHLNSTTGYRLDGSLPIVNNLLMPIEDKANVQVLKGAGALQYGISSAAGVVNYDMKRATDAPITSLAFAGNAYGQSIGTLDVGRRFGEYNQFGLRAILSGGEVINNVHNATGIKGVGALAGDWQPNDRFSMKIDFEQSGVDVVEQATILQNKPVNGRVLLPNVSLIDPHKLLSGPWSKYQGIGQNVLLKSAYELDEGFSLIGEAGRSETRKFQRSSAQIGTINLATGLGTEAVTLINNQDYINTYLKAELKHHYQYAFLTNDITFGVNRNERDFNGPTNGAASFPQNVYTPFPTVTPASPVPGGYYPTIDHDVGYYIAENIGIFDRVHLLGGVRAVSYTGSAVASTTGKENTSVTNFTAPSIGVNVDVVPGIVLYASYIQALQETGEAPQNAANAYQIQPPAPATQREIGVKATNLYNTTATFAYFEIQQANAITDSVTNIFGINGVQQFKGFEGTIAYRLTPSFQIVAGGQALLQAVQISSDPTINGKEPENMPWTSGNLGFVYHPEFVPGLTLNGTALYTGPRQLNNLLQGNLPETIIFNLGSSYSTEFQGHPVSYYANCTNLMDTRYYSSAVNGALGVGRPRTVTFGAKVSF